MAKKTPDPIDKHVGQRVRMQRMLLGLSQEKLGDAIGLTFQQVQKYEKGTNRISSSRLQHIADVFSVPVAFFFEGAPSADLATPGGAPADPLQELGQTSEGIRVARAFTSITDGKIRHGLLIAVEACAEAFARQSKQQAA